MTKTKPNLAIQKGATVIVEAEGVPDKASAQVVDSDAAEGTVRVRFRGEDGAPAERWVPMDAVREPEEGEEERHWSEDPANRIAGYKEAEKAIKGMKAGGKPAAK